ncbi:MAG TPA: ADP-ribosylglycohydrolase family protein [Kofleriaceae bacterium]|nr:ADP-ribosylglycohydrolase family protein [Kofleriaceae bacterium]
MQLQPKSAKSSVRVSTSRRTTPFHSACGFDSYEEAIWTATSQHGDRDTMGAIVGGVLGP